MCHHLKFLEKPWHLSTLPQYLQQDLAYSAQQMLDERMGKRVISWVETRCCQGFTYAGCTCVSLLNPAFIFWQEPTHGIVSCLSFGWGEEEVGSLFITPYLSSSEASISELISKRNAPYHALGCGEKQVINETS